MRIHKSVVVCLMAVTVLGLSRAACAQQTAQQAQTPAPLQAATPGPIPLGVNGQLAPWLQVRGEYRTRIEGFSNGGFVDGNDDAYWLGRLRLNATVRPSKSIGFFVQTQDARAFDKTTGGLLTPVRNTFDLRQAYGEFGTTTMVRAGRQEINLGEQRLIGGVNWLNNARTFDGGRLTIKRKGVTIDAFAVSVVTIQPDTSARSYGISTSGNGNALYGTYVSLTTLVPKQTLEPFFFWRQSRGIAAELGGTATLHQATTGARMAGKFSPTVDYSGDLVIQTGSAGPDSIRAWASHSVVGKTFAGVSLKPRVFGEFNHASGDTNAKDGTRGTFDQLYPTGHDKYGLADQVGWKNINHLRAGVELKPTTKWQVSGGYHSYWLASATDALYNAGGAVVARSTAGTAGRYVGQEVDIQTAYAYSPQLQLAGGFAHLIPGTFLKNTTQGHAYSYPFVMVTYVFLGEKPAIGGRRGQ
jgi:hypothetical protein